MANPNQTIQAHDAAVAAASERRAAEQRRLDALKALEKPASYPYSDAEWKASAAYQLAHIDAIKADEALAKAKETEAGAAKFESSVKDANNSPDDARKQQVVNDVQSSIDAGTGPFTAQERVDNAGKAEDRARANKATDASIAAASQNANSSSQNANTNASSAASSAKVNEERLKLEQSKAQIDKDLAERKITADEALRRQNAAANNAITALQNIQNAQQAETNRLTSENTQRGQEQNAQASGQSSSLGIMGYMIEWGKATGFKGSMEDLAKAAGVWQDFVTAGGKKSIDALGPRSTPGEALTNPKSVGPSTDKDGNPIEVVTRDSQGNIIGNGGSSTPQEKALAPDPNDHPATASAKGFLLDKFKEFRDAGGGDTLEDFQKHIIGTGTMDPRVTNPLKDKDELKITQADMDSLKAGKEPEGFKAPIPASSPEPAKSATPVNTVKTAPPAYIPPSSTDPNPPHENPSVIPPQSDPSIAPGNSSVDQTRMLNSSPNLGGPQIGGRTVPLAFQKGPGDMDRIAQAYNSPAPTQPITVNVNNAPPTVPPVDPNANASAHASGFSGDPSQSTAAQQQIAGAASQEAIGMMSEAGLTMGADHLTQKAGDALSMPNSYADWLRQQELQRAGTYAA